MECRQTGYNGARAYEYWICPHQVRNHGDAVTGSSCGRTLSKAHEVPGGRLE